jgi:uncharacterized protein (TIGR03437 family)
VKILHAATLQPAPFAPGQLVSLFGTGLSQNVEVRVNAQPAAIAYASDSQINFTLPASTAPDALIEVVRSNTVVAQATVALAASAPGLFGPIPAATRGSIVSLYATGIGAGNLPLSLRLGNIPVDILFVGDAPGAPAVTQLNVQLPGIFTAPGVYDVILTAGSNSSPAGLTIELR